ncbi:unnamed protein product [Acanthoscelides obtectus]|uniref:HTH CENPB-type domain-containing protein n=1 Tax=Acanthoscelides obtectus TaxID=200917 RepID=A0A9P0LJL0_ACAOB|nr:unnamed protein product [Acanthoscelides obtectus]CAK1681784.1 Tigger transposable element-derived protein 6 [Acanthoscelides obtectus]
MVYRTRHKGIPLTGPLIRCKPKEIADSLGYPTISDSSSWLNKFRIRHNMGFKAREGASVKAEDESSFLEKNPSLIKGYSLRDIYNADKTGLYFRPLPNKMLALKNATLTINNSTCGAVLKSVFNDQSFIQ